MYFDEQFVRSLVRDVPDYPDKGILFRDITPLLRDHRAFGMCIDALAAMEESNGIDCIVGIEARGFIIGSALAYSLGTGFVPIRKKGKLPYKKISKEYSLEYGTDSIEMHRDALPKGSKAMIVDDLLATGGTASAAAELVEESGCSISAIAFLIELEALGGREKLQERNVVSLMKY